MKSNTKLVRITTIPASIQKLLEGQLSYMKTYYEVVAVSSPGNVLRSIESNDGIRVYGVKMTRKITPISDLAAVCRLYFFLKKEKPMIVHTHTPKAGVIGMLAARLARIPIRLHTVAGLPLLEISGSKRLLLNLVEKLTYACATKVYPNSFELKKIIEENNFCNKEKLKVIANGSSNGINTEYFNIAYFSDDFKSSLRDKLNILPDDFVFIFVGRLVGDKGINELVKAFEIFQYSHPNSKLLLVGDFENDLDPLSIEVLNIIKTNINIILVGFQPDVRPYFAISNLLVFPSYREGFPNVVMQAGSMELPSIVSNINGCNEIIQDGINGIIIPVKNIDSIVAKMSLLFVDKSLYTELKANARKMIVNRYNQDIIWKALLKEYKYFEETLK